METPDIERQWNAQDAHGHRYMAQIADGKDRWLLPLPRSEWEQLWAAMARANPEFVEKFGTSQNFLRQYIGALMSYILEEGDWSHDPLIEAVALDHKIKQWDVRAQRIETTIHRIKDDSLPDDVRLAAVRILLDLPEREVQLVNPDVTEERLHEWAHHIELGA